MFYLNEFFRIARGHKALALANTLFLVLGVVSLQEKERLHDFFSLEAKTSSLPYFNALVDSQAGVESIARKMRNLPGVAKVEIKNASAAQSEIRRFLEGLGESAQSLGGEFSSFKIALDKNASPESRELIREYFSRLAGRNEVTFSPIKQPRGQKLNGSPLYSFFSNHASWHLAAVSGLGWLFSLWLLAHPLKAQSFIIERFQRKKKTALKMYAWLWGVPVLAFGAILVAFGEVPGWQPLTAAVALFFAGALLFLGNSKAPKRYI